MYRINDKKIVLNDQFGAIGSARKKLRKLLFLKFQYDSPVGPEGQFYGFGVELSNEGFYACMDTIQHVTRGTYSLHSLYSLLWANFSLLFVALLTQPGCVERLSGKLFSSGDTIVELCSAQMMRFWDLLCSGLSVSEEERSLLVTDCLNRLIEVSVTML